MNHVRYVVPSTPTPDTNVPISTDMAILVQYRLLKERLDPALKVVSPVVNGCKQIRFVLVRRQRMHANYQFLSRTDCSSYTTRIKHYSGERHFYHGGLLKRPPAN